MGVFRILSLDGGGCWSLLEVMALQEIYGAGARGYDVLKNFDLVAANSGGSIVLGGLLTNRPLSDLYDFFLSSKDRSSIFKQLPFELDEWPKPLRTVWNVGLNRLVKIGARYDTRAKLNGLRDLLGATGNKSLPELHRDFRFQYGRTLHMLICGYDYDLRRAKFFRSNAASLTASRQEPLPNLASAPISGKARNVTLAEAIYASTNAPVKYFVDPAVIDRSGEGGAVERFWDGAIAGHNNPIMCAVVEVLANRSYNNADRIQVLSLGTGTVSLPSPALGSAQDPALMQAEYRNRTLFEDLEEVASSFLDDPPDSATFVAHVVLGGLLPDANASPPIRTPLSGAVIRMNPLIRPVRSYPGAQWTLPPGLTVEDFKKLKVLNLDVVEDEDMDLIRRFGELWIGGQMSNQPIREDKAFELQIGHRTFGEAQAAWKNLMRVLPETGRSQPA